MFNQIWCSSVPPSNKAGELWVIILQVAILWHLWRFSPKTRNDQNKSHRSPQTPALASKRNQTTKTTWKLLHWSLSEQFALSSLEDNGRCVIPMNSRHCYTAIWSFEFLYPLTKLSELVYIHKVCPTRFSLSTAYSQGHLERTAWCTTSETFQFLSIFGLCIFLDSGHYALHVIFRILLQFLAKVFHKENWVGANWQTNTA